MNFRTETRFDRYGVAFGTGTWISIDQLGLIHLDFFEKDPLDRQFYASGVRILDLAAARARTLRPGPYGKKDSAKRRKFCDRVASLANDLEAQER